MQGKLAIVAAALLGLGAAMAGSADPAWAEGRNPWSEMPKRGHTFTTDEDVSRMDKRAGANRNEIFILRGTEGKASNQNSIVLKMAPEAPPAAEEPPPKPKHRRGWNRN